MSYKILRGVMNIEFIQKDRQGKIIPPPGIMDEIAKEITHFRRRVIPINREHGGCPFFSNHNRFNDSPIKCDILFPVWSTSNFRLSRFGRFARYTTTCRGFHCPCEIYGVVHIAILVREKLKGYVNYPEIDKSIY